jgi:hypothetical protein
MVSEKSWAAIFIPRGGVDSNAASNRNGCLVQEAELSGQALNRCPRRVITGVPVDVSMVVDALEARSSSRSRAAVRRAPDYGRACVMNGTTGSIRSSNRW